MTPRIRHVPPAFWGLATACLALDAATKWWATATPAPHIPTPVISSVVRLRLVHNPDLAFSLTLPGGGSLVYAALGAAVLALVLYGASIVPRRARLYLGGLALLFGGGAANLLERVIRGMVTDFLDIGIGRYRWPTFNVADACITLGLVTLVWLRLRDGLREEGWRRMLVPWPLSLRDTLLPPSLRS